MKVVCSGCGAPAPIGAALQNDNGVACLRERETTGGNKVTHVEPSWQNGSWRWNGKAWEHKCSGNHPQHGHSPTIEAQVPDELSDYDWEAAFECAARDDTSWVVGEDQPPGDCTPFDREDVAEVYGLSEGANDGSSWVVACRLRDGRFAFVEASCDYTGWG